MMWRFLYCQKDLQWNWRSLVKCCLKWHFRDENKDIHRDKFNPKSKVNLRNKGGAIELYLSSLEKKLMKVEGPKGKFNKLTNSECKALYDLKMIKKY